MENLQVKIDSKKDAIKAAKKELKNAKSEYKATQADKARGFVVTLFVKYIVLYSPSRIVILCRVTGSPDVM